MGWIVWCVQQHPAHRAAAAQRGCHPVVLLAQVGFGTAVTGAHAARLSLFNALQGHGAPRKETRRSVCERLALMTDKQGATLIRPSEWDVQTQLPHRLAAANGIRQRATLADMVAIAAALLGHTVAIED